MLSNGAYDAQTYYRHDVVNPSLDGEIFSASDLHQNNFKDSKTMVQSLNKENNNSTSQMVIKTGDNTYMLPPPPPAVPRASKVSKNIFSPKN